VHGVLVPRALVAVPVGPGQRAVPMPVVIAIRARVAVPVSPGERALPMHLAVAPRARVAVPVSPGVRALPVPLVVAPRSRVGAAIVKCDDVMPVPRHLFVSGEGLVQRNTSLDTVRVSRYLYFSRYHFVQCRGRNHLRQAAIRPLRCCASVPRKN